MSRKKVTPNSETSEVKQPMNSKEIIGQIIKRKTKEKFLTETQKKYYETLINNEIIAS